MAASFTQFRERYESASFSHFLQNVSGLSARTSCLWSVREVTIARVFAHSDRMSGLCRFLFFARLHFVSWDSSYTIHNIFTFYVRAVHGQWTSLLLSSHNLLLPLVATWQPPCGLTPLTVDEQTLRVTIAHLLTILSHLGNYITFSPFRRLSLTLALGTWMRILEHDPCQI